MDRNRVEAPITELMENIRRRLDLIFLNEKLQKLKIVHVHLKNVLETKLTVQALLKELVHHLVIAHLVYALVAVDLVNKRRKL